MLVLSLLLSASTFLNAGPYKDSLTSATPVFTAVNKSILLQLVNKTRKTGYQCGNTYYDPAPPLTWNDKLEQAATIHTLDMAEKNYFNHISNSGSNPGVRISGTGYSWRTYGENIAMGYNTEREVIEGWLKSPGHCKNIMNKNFKEMGIAREGTYWTQVLGARK
jgi:uncharacterized protein YkwD